MPTETTRRAPQCATIFVTDVPEGDTATRVLALANRAKDIAYHGGDDRYPMPDDSVFVRAALALDNALRYAVNGDGQDAGLLVALTVANLHTPTTEDTEKRQALISTKLASPVANFASEIMGTVKRSRSGADDS